MKDVALSSRIKTNVRCRPRRNQDTKYDTLRIENSMDAKNVRCVAIFKR